MLIHLNKKEKKKDKDATYLCSCVSDVLLKLIHLSANDLCSGVKWSSNLEVLNRRDV